MYKIVLLRHGESTWNLENRFTGWTDVDLSEKGIIEAQNAGKLLKEAGFSFDIAFTSVLKRAIRTLWIVQDIMNLMWLPIVHSWRLNERHYGALQGLNKSEMAKQYGEEQVHIWRRSYDIQPPALEKNDLRWSGKDPCYKNMDLSLIPYTECLKDTVNRFLPFWYDQIIPELILGKKIIIVAHGNSLRALVKHLDNVSEKEITELNIPTGIPLIYELNENFKPIKHYYLGDAAALETAMQAVANQGKAG